MSDYIVVTRPGKSKGAYLARKKLGTERAYVVIAEFYDPVSAQKALDEMVIEPVVERLAERGAPKRVA